MKNKFIFTATAVVLLCVGVLLYAANNKSTTLTAFSTEEVADNTETVSSPPEVPCTAYAYLIRDVNTLEETYLVTNYELNVGTYDGKVYIFIESMEGETMDCEECPVQCTAFYELCLKYNVDYEY